VLTVVSIQIADFCAKTPRTLIRIKDLGQPTASIISSGKLYGFTKGMNRDSTAENVKLDKLRSKRKGSQIVEAEVGKSLRRKYSQTIPY
jgi:hypothetical protein